MAKKYGTEDLIKAHKYSMNHKAMLLKDDLCGCFSCLTIFRPHEIKEWIQDETGTAICPYCYIDAVIGESSGYPITKEFLDEMNKQWFGGDKDVFWLG